MSDGNTRHLMTILRQAMSDPALSGGCGLLERLFEVIAEDEAAESLLEKISGWKVPGLMLSAALLYRAAEDSAHFLARYWAEPDLSREEGFRSAVRRVLAEDAGELLKLTERHTYQCNPPRRMAVSLLAAAMFTKGWGPAWHIDVGTASGVGLLLGEVAVEAGGVRLGRADALLKYPLELRGSVPDFSGLVAPLIERSVGIDLDPPDLRDAHSLAWMRACQFPVAAELGYFDEAVRLRLEREPRIERGAATDWLPILAAEMPAGQPLLVTDTYVTLFMSEDDREKMRRELDLIAQSRPVVWVSNNSLVPAGAMPTDTTAGTGIPGDLAERNGRELFGVVCVTTWSGGKRMPRIVGVNHPGACWVDWR